jgi:phospholipid-translocating ATPase
VDQDRVFPSDLLFIQSSEKAGYCYVETKNLDGETNLKTKFVPLPINKLMQTVPSVKDFSGRIICEDTND